VKTIFKNLLALPSGVGMGRRIWLLALCAWLAMFSSASAGTMLDTGDPVGFFTTVADKMLQSTFSFGVTNIPVETNGIFVYSPAVQRLLQLSANLYDATTTNFYPTVFRPVFYRDASNNVFITGYKRVMLTANPPDTDPQLDVPVDITDLPVGASTDNYPNGVNLYGVPWIIGAKKGLPNFNEFSMQDIVQVTRKLQVIRSDTNVTPRFPIYNTNQMYVFGITNNLALECWNSYTNAYSNPVRIVVKNHLSMTLTNTGALAISSNFYMYVSTNITLWPGSRWDYYANALIQGDPSPFVIALKTNVVFLPTSVYRFATQSFVPVTGSTVWETNLNLIQLPQFGLVTSNFLQFFMLDGSNVIDYVHLNGPTSQRNLSAELNNPDQYDPHGLWQTNLLGVYNQLKLSRGLFVPNAVPSEDGGFWMPPAGVAGVTTPPQDQAYFNAMFMPGNEGTAPAMGGNPSATEDNLSYGTQAPYTPIRTMYEFISWQANDPLVHHLAGDLNYSGMVQGNGASLPTGIANSDHAPIPYQPNIGNLNDRYAPWGNAGLARVGIDTNGFNLAYRDPLVRISDDWNFPGGNGLPLATLGQVHRGTPWQTVYLKSSNILAYVDLSLPVSPVNGTNTWMNWTGNPDPRDAALAAPVNDRQLAGMLVALFNTNDPAQLVSVNDGNTADWLGVLDGIMVQTNSISPFDFLVMSSNSPQALIIANAVAQSRTTQPGQRFDSTGDILATPELSVQSPWLYNSNVNNGVSDQAYEAIPAQLLPRLRPDSRGAMVQVNGGWNIRFSGSDGFAYALQTSTDLATWEVVSTNYPVQGSFSVFIPPAPDSPVRFYRSALLP